jgi:hypothetical protein
MSNRTKLAQLVHVEPCKRSFCVIIKDPVELLTPDRYESPIEALADAKRWLESYPEKERVFIYSIILVGQARCNSQGDDDSE